MNSETLTLQCKWNRGDTIQSFIDTLTEYFTAKGFTIDTREGFGNVNGELFFGVKVTEEVGILIETRNYSSTPGGTNNSGFRFGVYNITSDDTINVKWSSGIYTFFDVTSGGSLGATSYQYININYHKDSDNVYIDMQHSGSNAGNFAGFLITPHFNLDSVNMPDKCLLYFNSSGYVGYGMTTEQINNGTYAVIPNCGLQLKDSRYTCYFCDAVVSSSNSVGHANLTGGYILGVLPKVKGILGNFTHTFAQEIVIDGKTYFCLSRRLYIQIN